jgi:hypothetical protein
MVLVMNDLRLRIRLRAWLRREELVEALADGADPDQSEELTHVARELIGARSRQRLADGLDRVLRATAERHVPWSPAVPLNRHEIAEAREELAELAERLRAPGPVPVHAGALAAMLVADAKSPLYSRMPGTSAWDLARTALRALDDPIA